MRLSLYLPVAVLALACTTGARHPHHASDAASPYAAASGVSRPGEGDQPFRVVPLRPMSGDVEILYGDPEKAGEPFAMRIRELPGTMIPPHSHPVDEHITVVQGTWYFAVGDKWDRAALKELKVGDYAFAAKGSTMFGYCPDGAIVQVQGVGPFLIHWKHGVSTLDDANAATVFTFRKGERVQAMRGKGTIHQGYASGSIIQYEIGGDDGVVFMANQDELQRI
ncbi:MAG: cupin domain-containing protein [Thermoanaerobaculia bacterium]